MTEVELTGRAVVDSMVLAKLLATVLAEHPDMLLDWLEANADEVVLAIRRGQQAQEREG
jgi:hypothetical protein